MGRKALKNNSLPGSLDMLILKTLSRSNLHGYAIAQSIQIVSGNEILIEEGSLYPALQRLELHGWIDGNWGLTPSNRNACIYHITPRGRRQLAHEMQRYKQLTLAIARVMGKEWGGHARSTAPILAQEREEGCRIARGDGTSHRRKGGRIAG